MFGVFIMYVCLCEGITEKDIKEAMAQGVDSLKGLEQHLGLGADCRSCVGHAYGLLKNNEKRETIQGNFGFGIGLAYNAL